MHPVWSKFSFYTQPYHCSQDNAGVIVNDKGEMKGSAIQARSERFHVGLPMRGVCTSVPNIHRFITTVPRWASHVRRTPGPCGEGMRRAVAENCLLRTGHLLSSRIPRSRWGPARKERWMGTLGWPLLVTHWTTGQLELAKGVDSFTCQVAIFVGGRVSLYWSPEHEAVVCA